ncbi:hypothetical protein L209DRAFT_266235 [Thermothelomyces heterothallicus CBS 203.75]
MTLHTVIWTAMSCFVLLTRHFPVTSGHLATLLRAPLIFDTAGHCVTEYGLQSVACQSRVPEEPSSCLADSCVKPGNCPIRVVLGSETTGTGQIDDATTKSLKKKHGNSVQRSTKQRSTTSPHPIAPSVRRRPQPTSFSCILTVHRGSRAELTTSCNPYSRDALRP